MKIEHQLTPELTQLSELIEGMKICMLTNADNTGALISRPMSALKMDAEGAIWFFTDLRSSVVEQLRPVNLAFSDEGKSTYVSLAGYCEVITDSVLIQQMWTSAAKPWFPEGPDSINLALLKFIPETAEYWDAPESQMVRLFAMAASIVSGKPVALGEHGNISNLSQSMSGGQRSDN